MTSPRALVVAAALAPGPTLAQVPPAACPAGTPVAGTPALRPQLVADGLTAPVDLRAPAGDRERLFVVEQVGRIRLIVAGDLRATPFLDLSQRVAGGFEQGLLGLAFHPAYADNGRLFVNYTTLDGTTRIAEFRASSDPERADPTSERVLLSVAQPFANHNGGGLAFGPDGALYIALGDGGGAGDPRENGQDLATPLGSILRVNVDGAAPFEVPSDNPFLDRPEAFPATWAYGLRNPWRIAFDAATGDLYIGDVGQDRVEEIDVGFASAAGGENYGWNVTEGSLCFDPPTGCSGRGLTPPVLEYGHGEGCSVTGGVVYRGCRLPAYQGMYFYADFCSAFVRSFRIEGGGVFEHLDWTDSLGRGAGIDRISSFGVDADGEIYVLDLDGEVYKVVPVEP